jgi:phosphonatase-like hydrolase
MITELVVFDIAGTTVKDPGKVADSFQAAFLERGIEVDKESINHVMGFRKVEAIKMVLEKMNLKTSESLVNEIHDVFEENMLSYYMSSKDLSPLPNAETAFKWLHSKGIKVALNTGFTRNITEGILYRLHWKDSPLIDAVICSDEVPEGRPKPYMIRELMKRFDIRESKKVVKVGDTEVDVAEGRNAGCGQVISVTTGAYSRAELEFCMPDAVIDDLSMLPALIL